MKTSDISNGFESDMHRLLSGVAKAISSEVEIRSGLVLTSMSGKSVSGGTISASLTYTGDATEEAKSKVDSVMQRAGNASEMIALLKKVGLG